MRLIDAVDNAPTVAEPVRHGEWENVDRMCSAIFYRCSCCKGVVDISGGMFEDNYYNYCPHCGAKMDGGAENEQKY